MSSTTTSRRSRAPTPLVAINSLVIDVSGSTYSMGDAPMEQIHELMTKLKEDAITNNTNIRLSLHTFNGTVRQVIPTNPTELSVDMRTYTVPSLATIRDILRPGGSTALYDAGIQGLDHIEKIYEQEWNKLPKAVRSLNPTITKCFVLATDGLDNQSTHSISDFKTRTLVAKKNNVQPLFLFANIGSEMGEKMGFKKSNAAQFTPSYVGVTNMMRATTECLRQVSSGQTPTIDSQTLSHTTSSPTSPRSPRTPPYNLRAGNMSPPPLLRAHAHRGGSVSPPPLLRRY